MHWSELSVRWQRKLPKRYEWVIYPIRLRIHALQCKCSIGSTHATQTVVVAQTYSQPSISQSIVKAYRINLHCHRYRVKSVKKSTQWWREDLRWDSNDDTGSLGNTMVKTSVDWIYFRDRYSWELHMWLPTVHIIRHVWDEFEASRRTKERERWRQGLV